MQLRQAVMEMAQNAIEWGNRHQSDRLVRITYRVYEDRLEIVVRDQGPGFDRGDLPHAAVADDPFTHLDVRDKLGLRAGGFGLLICQGMVDEMQLQRRGQRGHADQAVPRVRNPPESAAGRRRRADRSTASAPIVDRVATPGGLRRPMSARPRRDGPWCWSSTTSPRSSARSTTCSGSTTRSSPARAAPRPSTSSSREPDVAVILSDQRMPGMTGVEVLRRARPIRPETTRLLFTAYADIHAVIDAINQGHVFRYITKPWEPDELQLAIRQAVERHDLIVEKHRLLAELQATNARLAEANRLKTAFLEVASHELNTPVTVVLGLTELWKLTQGPTASPAEPHWVERINAAASRLARTVEPDAQARRERRVRPHPERRDRRPRAPDPRPPSTTLAPYLEARRQDGRDRRPGRTSSPIEGDPAKLPDILINLLANAIKFTPDGGTIRIAARDDADDPDAVRVEVQDQGVGVHPTSSATCSSRSSPGSTRSTTPRASTSSASAGSAWASAWSRRSSSSTAAGSRSPPPPARARPSPSSSRPTDPD